MSPLPKPPACDQSAATDRAKPEPPGVQIRNPKSEIVKTAGIALGSNIEPRLENLRRAGQHLRQLAVPNTPFLMSRVYETAPVDCPPDSPPFLNAALELTTTLEPHALLSELLRIESLLGRPPRHALNAPRPIDLDILYFNNLSLQTKDLVLPHPCLTVRRFVLQPLADIHPDLVIETKTVDQWLSELPEHESLKLNNSSFL